MGRQTFAKRNHSPGFKLEAVRVMHERVAAGLTVQRVSEELEVSTSLLRSWAHQVASAPEGATVDEIFPGRGHLRTYKVESAVPRAAGPPTPEAELQRLRRENERLRLERDFLKKAAAFFAKESR